MKPYHIFRSLRIDEPIGFIQKNVEFFLIQIKKVLYHKSIRHSSFTPKKVRILIIANLGGIGNCIASTPLVQCLRMLYPKSNITFLTTPGDLFDNWCIVDSCISKKENIDPDVIFDKVFVTYWGYPHPPSWVKEIKTKKFFKPSIWFNSWFLKPERDYNVDMARKDGYKGLTPAEYVSVKQTEYSELYKEAIVVLPCSNNDPRWQPKRWPYYGELIKLLRKEFVNSKILILGTTDDSIEGIEISEDVIDLRGKLSLAESAGLIKNAKLVVANDCGPAHIADCVGTKTFVIFGPTCEVKNRYINKTTPILPSCNCSPCQYDKIKKSCSECITDIKAKDVFNTISNSLKNKI